MKRAGPRGSVKNMENTAKNIRGYTDIFYSVASSIIRDLTLAQHRCRTNANRRPTNPDLRHFTAFHARLFPPLFACTSTKDNIFYI